MEHIKDFYKFIFNFESIDFNNFVKQPEITPAVFVLPEKNYINIFKVVDVIRASYITYNLGDVIEFNNLEE